MGHNYIGHNYIGYLCGHECNIRVAKNTDMCVGARACSTKLSRSGLEHFSTHVETRVKNMFTPVFTRTFTHMVAQMCTYMFTHVCTHICTHMFTHTFAPMVAHKHTHMVIDTDLLGKASNVRGHSYIGHICIDHNYIGHNYIGDAHGPARQGWSSAPLHAITTMAITT